MTDEFNEQNDEISEPELSAADSGAGTRGGENDSYERSGGRRPYHRTESGDSSKGGALEVTVDHNIEKAIKILKRKLIKEGLFKELKMRRYYEKPSERKKRKLKESLKKIRKEESRNRKNQSLFS